MQKIAEYELKRNVRIVDEIKAFELCAICNIGDGQGPSPDEPEQICQKNCGSKLVKNCVPHFIKFGKDQDTINDITEELERCNEAIQLKAEQKKINAKLSVLSEKSKNAKRIRRLKTTV